jgi:uncharacterized Fe-S cluster-containing radical SAM superfamily enzyme
VERLASLTWIKGLLMPTDNEYLRLLYTAVPPRPFADRYTVDSLSPIQVINFERRTRLSCAYRIGDNQVPAEVVIEGRMFENGDWVNLSADGQTIVHPDDGIYFLSWEGVAYEVRFRLVSGNSTIVVDVRIQ